MNTQPPSSLWRVYITAGACVLFAGAYTTLGISPPPLVLLVTYNAAPVSAVLWLQRDARVQRVATVHDWGMLAFIAWPVMIPWYTIKTRGVGSGLPLAAALLLPVLAAPLVYLVGSLVRGSR